ncbi:nucleotidyltransferase domain-containing protein [Mangrovibacillus cuniculi]|uniref:Nucleotidyltransferase domain-containing protein n=2 Tax=Mangrovibacillus cuniculi TaxID=2593652 RepID=A0A7S8CEG7_9BACI|nr:nucleotidyltransferase domain-containing protein [Mangrovibacillus cuniculi]
MKVEKDAAFQVIRDTLLKKLSPSLIYIFGSQVSGYTHEESDYDVAFLSEKKLHNYDRFILSQEIASLLNKDVDLVDLHQASTVFQVQIIMKGKLLYCGDENKKELFEMLALKKYARLNEERNIIIKESLERGYIYEE